MNAARRLATTSKSRSGRLPTVSNSKGISVRLRQVARRGEISRFVISSPSGALAEACLLLNDTKPLSIIPPRNVGRIGNNRSIGIGTESPEPFCWVMQPAVAPRTELKGVLLLQAVGQGNAGMRVDLACT